MKKGKWYSESAMIRGIKWHVAIDKSNTLCGRKFIRPSEGRTSTDLWDSVKCLKCLKRLKAQSEAG